MDVRNNLKLNQHELIEAVMHPLAAAPASSVAGQVYFNNTDNILYGYNGTVWRNLFQLEIDDTDTTSNDKTWSIEKLVSMFDALDSQIAGGMHFIGGYDAAANTPDLEAGAGVKLGDTYVVTADGDFFTEGMQIGDSMIAKVDDPASLADWVVVNKNIPDIVDATNAVKGLIRIATDTEAIDGTDETLAVNPKQLKDALATTVKTFSIVQSLGDAEGVTTITHNLNTLDVQVQFAVESTGQQVFIDIDSKTVNTIDVEALGASEDYRIIVQG